MSLYREALGHPLTAAQVELLRELVDKHLAPLDDVFKRAAIWAAIADQQIHTMALLGVPILDFLKQHPLPVSVDEAIKLYGTTPQHKREIQYASDNAAVLVQGWKEETRARLIGLVNAGVRGRMSGGDLAQLLSDHFADVNRDFTRIAETELAGTTNNGMLAGQPPGSYVLGQSFKDACAWCRKYFHGQVFKVIAPPPRGVADWDREIWIGKSNVGRYQSVHERGTGRVRESWELWKPCPSNHVHCRCWLVAFDPKRHVVDAAGHLQLNPDLLARHRKRKEEGHAVQVRLRDGGVSDAIVATPV